MKPKPIPQTEVHYVKPWSRIIELLVLTKLECAKKAGQWEPGDPVGNMAVVEKICEELTDHPYWLEIPKEKYHAKVNEWWCRFYRFHSLLKDDRTWYCEETKRVFTTDLSWQQIGEEKPELLCYMEEGEANWDILKSLFYEEGIYSDSDEDE